MKKFLTFQFRKNENLVHIQVNLLRIEPTYIVGNWN